MQSFKSWVKASRLPAQLFIFPSLLFGQAMAFVVTGSFDFMLFLIIHLYGLFMHFLIVYANDYADYETDKMNQSFTPFTGGSRVLIEGLLTKKALLKASLLMLGLILIIGIYLSLVIGNLMSLLLIILGLLVFHAYSFGPVKLSYRGYGEILQMIGVGIGLPLIAYSVQGGSLEGIPIGLLIALLPAQLAMAISTSLPDEPSDRLSQKRTTVVNIGITPARTVLVTLYALTLVLLYGLQTTLRVNPIFTFVLILFITVQAALAIRKTVLPGTKAMFYFVALSILTNTVIVTGIAIKLFI